jgi:hypothetical protein
MKTCVFWLWLVASAAVAWWQVGTWIGAWIWPPAPPAVQRVDGAQSPAIQAGGNVTVTYPDGR